MHESTSKKHSTAAHLLYLLDFVYSRRVLLLQADHGNEQLLGEYEVFVHLWQLLQPIQALAALHSRSAVHRLPRGSQCLCM